MSHTPDLRAIAALSELHSRTTQGEWFQRSDGWTVRVRDEADEEGYGAFICHTHVDSVPVSEQVANSEFIAEAHNAVPALLGALAQMQEAMRWHYPKEENETEKLPDERIEVIVEDMEDVMRIGIRAPYDDAEEESSWFDAREEFEISCKRWRYIEPPAQARASGTGEGE